MKIKCANTMNKIASYFDKEMRGENLPYITKKLSYYRNLFESLDKETTLNEYDLGNLIKFETVLKSQKGLTLPEIFSRFDDFCLELHLEGMARMADNVMNFEHPKLFDMARWNGNIASMIRIESEFNVTLDRVMKRRLPVLRALAKENNITISY